MDVREKLVELLKEIVAIQECGFGDPRPTYETVASYLMSHGVMVQECGHWIYDFNLAGSNFYRCSVCDRQETLLEKENIYDYCPFCHCGAKMIPQPSKGE